MKKYRLNGDVEVWEDSGKLATIDHVEIIEASDDASREELIELSLAGFTEQQEPVWCKGYPHIEEVHDEQQSQTFQLPHTLMKDLESASHNIASEVGSLSRGKLSEYTTMTCLVSLEYQAKRLTETIEKAKQALRGDSSWQRN